MPISRRHFLGAAAGLAFARPALAQTSAPIKGVRFALDWALEGQQSPFVLAADGGYFERAGVEVKVDRGYGSGDTVTKIASGAYDIGFADLGAAISFKRQAEQAGADQRVPGLRYRADVDHDAEGLRHRQAG